MNEIDRRQVRSGVVGATLIGAGFVGGVLLADALGTRAVAEAADPVFAGAVARPIRAVAVEAEGWAIAECNGIYFTVNAKGEAHPIKFPSDEISAAKGETLLRSPG
jgi:hypothetical protein